ncbi:MAG: protein translocase subunit SecD [Rickettsiales bacterium]
MLEFPKWKIITITSACLLFVIMAIPSLISEARRNSLPDWFPVHAVTLGLDLQGGSHLLLEVDFNHYIKEQFENLKSDIRIKLRAKQIGYRDLRISKNDGQRNIIFKLRNETDSANIEKILEEINPDIEIIGKDALSYTVGFKDKFIKAERVRVIEQSLEIVNRRVNETGTKEPIIQRQGDNRIVLQVPGLKDPERLKEILGRTAKMTFHMVNDSVSADDIALGNVPVGTKILSGDEVDNNGNSPKYAIDSRVMLSGDMLVDAHTTFDNQTGEPVVAFRFNHAGARKFATITSENIGKPFAVILDKKVITAPVIRSAILNGNGVISGNFTAQSAKDLAILLRAGALPAPLKIIEERSVGPSLGADSIKSGAIASIIALILVIVFMVMFYGLFGLFADVAMIINAFMIITFLAMFGATLTLPGIAGIILTIGMAVDANVLIYERIREEARNGKPIHRAVSDGFKIAFGTIFDSNITTLLAAMLLYYFGTGTVKGFAVTLTIGILCSLFTSIMVTRMMVVGWLKAKKRTKLPI